MKNFLITNRRHSILSGLAAIGLLGMSACATTDQLSQYDEGDDMYFNAKDRNLVSFTALNESEKASYDNKGSYKYDDDNYSSKNVNPDLVAEYQNDNNKKADDQGEYYVEEQDRNYGNRPIINNNYYGQPYGGYGNSGFNNPYYDPFYSSAYGGFGGYGGFGRNSFFRPGLNIGMSFGFGSPFGWGRPYYGYNGFGGFGNSYGYGGFYDPFSPFNDPYGYAYNPYYGGGYGYRPNVIIVNNNTEGIRGPIRTNVPSAGRASQQRTNIADVRGAAPGRGIDRANSVNNTRSSYRGSSPDFSSQNTINKGDFRRQANQRIFESRNSSASNASRSNSYVPQRNSNQSRYGNSQGILITKGITIVLLILGILIIEAITIALTLAVTAILALVVVTLAVAVPAKILLLGPSGGRGRP